MAPFRYVGRFSDTGERNAAIFVGGNGGLLVPSASSLTRVSEIARKLVAQVPLAAAATRETFKRDPLIEDPQG